MLVSQPTACLPTLGYCLTSYSAWWLLLYAGLAGHGDSPSPSSIQPRTVYSSRFQLAAHERCLLRLKLTCGLEEGQTSNCSTGQGNPLSWHDVAIRPAGRSTGQPAASTAAAAADPAATVRVGVQLLPAPLVDRTLRLYCSASGGRGSAAVQHSVDLAQLPGGERLLQVGQPAVFVTSSPAVRAAIEGSRLVLSCTAGEAGSTQRCFVAAYSPGQGSHDRRGSSGGSGRAAATAAAASCPTEVWEVFAHSLPALRLAAGLGTAATASCFIDHAAAASSRAGAQLQGLACSWMGCGAAELAASLGSGPSTATPGAGRSSRLVLFYEPTAVGRRELLLSVVASRAGQLGAAAAQGDKQAGQRAPGRPQQVELLLVQLDSSSTRFSRTFEVDALAGQSVSKKVRYSNPHPQPRRFAVRSLQPELLRPAHKWQRAAGGVLLQPGEEASIRLSFDGAAAAAAAGHSRGGCRQCEVFAVLESAPAGGRAWEVEEVFRVLLRAA